MWLIARGAMADIDPAPLGAVLPDATKNVAAHDHPVSVKHRFYHVPASNTAVGHLILENT
jgi:protocatechuate 4,5-dioxygenase beta chain